ncbi:hypothetical protein KR018_001669 [Drosophila ironensis]|nr:hypothetical protein KR018_001669 [Drosophila ironensis]
MNINSCLDPQVQLGTALEKRNIKEFRAAVDMGADPGRQDKHHGSIYEKALSTPGCREFIEACIEHGCHVNYVNERLNKAAINFAADSRDPGNVYALLRPRRDGDPVQVDRRYAELTPLNSLAKNLTEANWNEVKACMELLLNHGASPNAVDQREFTALHMVLRNRKIPEEAKKKLVTLFLSQSSLDIDCFREGEVRTLLEESHPELQLPVKRETPPQPDVEQLKRTLINCGEEKFLDQLGKYLRNFSGSPDHQRAGEQGDNQALLSDSRDNNQRIADQENFQKLLLESIKRGKHQALNAVLAAGVNINGSNKPGGASPVEVAAITGNWQALERLLKERELQVKNLTLLNELMSKLEWPSYDFVNYERCFKVLLTSDRVNINEADKAGFTPLFYAVKYRNRRAAAELLQHGAYIGAKAIEELPSDLLQECFDACITTNGMNPTNPNFEIQMDFKNLMYRNPGKPLHHEMTPIAFMAESQDLRHLLRHPLVSAFLFLKWHRLFLFFFANMILYSLFTFSITMHTLYKFNENAGSAVTEIFGVLTWVGIAYLIIRELVQLLMSRWQYFRSFTNWMELALIFLSIFNRMDFVQDKDTQRFLAVLNVLLVSVELCLLVGSLPLPSISTHMLMLRAVLSSFVKSFTFYSIFVITFGLCFYILFGIPLDQDANATTPSPSVAPSSESGGDGDFNTFSKPLLALIKTIVMLTGEFDAGDIKFTNAYTYLIFLLFVFFMSIVLFNLLNGLAVSDTQVIKAQAELNGAICRANVLKHYEGVLTSPNGPVQNLFGSQPLLNFCQRRLNLYQDYECVISVLPNQGNRVIVSKRVAYELKTLNKTKTAAQSEDLPNRELLDAPHELLSCCCTGGCSQIDSSIVKLSLALLEQKASAKQKRLQEREYQQRQEHIEERLDKLLQLIQEQNKHAS